MNLFDGLLLFEIVLLALGILLFCLLVWMLVYGTLPKGGIGLFLVSVLMIGYPGVQKWSFMNGLIAVDNYTKTVATATGSERAEASKNLKLRLSAIDPDRVQAPETFSIIAQAQEAIGEREKALKNVDKALALQPGLSKAIALKRKLQEAPL